MTLEIVNVKCEEYDEENSKDTPLPTVHTREDILSVGTRICDSLVVK